MPFQVGDQVVHWSYGPGKIIQLDEKRILGRSDLYYVVQVRDLTLWVPVEGADRLRLRPPTPKRDFKRLFDILRGPAEQLSEDRLERKTQLSGQLRDGTLKSICRTIRDLSSYSYRKKLNEYDSALLERARKLLLDEWEMSFSIPAKDAQHELDLLLEEGRNRH
jgi:CarD family transcriptional regulator